MEVSADLILSSIALGVGLAMDAFSVSMANGLSEFGMSKGKMAGVAGTYGFFQIAMPLIGWFCVHAIAEKFQVFRAYIPWIALILLLWIGGKMLIEGIQDTKKLKNEGVQPEQRVLGFAELLAQGIATSIDALSVGFTIAEYSAGTAILSATIIGVVTFFICIAGLIIGKKIGTKLAGRASILGGIILIAIGIKIWLGGSL